MHFTSTAVSHVLYTSHVYKPVRGSWVDVFELHVDDIIYFSLSSAERIQSTARGRKVRQDGGGQFAAAEESCT